MADVFVKKTKKYGYALFPTDAESLKYIKRMPNETVFRVVITQARNYQFHKKLFALLKIGFDNSKLNIKTEDGYREYILIKSGHFFTNTFPDYVQFKAKSISYEKLSQNKFNDLYPTVRSEVAKDVGITSEEMEIKVLDQF